MGKPLRGLLISLVCIALLGGGAWYLLTAPEPVADQVTTTTTQRFQLSDYTWNQVSRVDFSGTNGAYSIAQAPDGTLTVGDIPQAVLNTAYVQDLLSTCSTLTYAEAITDGSNLSAFGLDYPNTVVTITYDDGQQAQLLIGNEEPISQGRYAKLVDDDAVILLTRESGIRLTMAMERYIDYMIIPANLDDVLLCVSTMTLSGSAFQEPIVLKEVASDDEEMMELAMAFGATSHLMLSPQLHEVDQTNFTTLLADLLGLISEEIVAYNRSEEDLATLGFDDPLIRFQFDYRVDETAPLQSYDLRVVRQSVGTYIVTLDDLGVVYRIDNTLSFLQMDYDDLILRWLLSPLITDIAQVDLLLEGETYRFILTGDTPQTLAVTCNGDEVDITGFRSLYTQLVSAQLEGASLPVSDAPDETPLFQITYTYRSETKSPDTLALYPSGTRRLLVAVNDLVEFEMQDTFPDTIALSLAALLQGES